MGVDPGGKGPFASCMQAEVVIITLLLYLYVLDVAI